MNAEEHARLRSAHRIADWCRAQDYTAEDITGMDTDRRAALSVAAKKAENLKVTKPASPATWQVVIGLLGTPDHRTTVGDGGLSNWTVTCTCGKRWGVATTNRQLAEASGADHVAAYARPVLDDPFAGLPN